MALLKKENTLSAQVPLSLEEKIARIRLYRTPTIGPIFYQTLLSRYKTAQQALEELPALTQRRSLKNIIIYPSEKVLREMEAHKKRGAFLVVQGDPEYPRAFLGVPDAPPVISVLGKLHCLQEKAIAIVGARNASLTGKKMAQLLAQDLGKAGYQVVSGLARGVDTHAHLGAITTGTIAVIAGGIDTIYPPENKDLFEKIAFQGTIITESPLGTAPQGSLFPRRNRLISGLVQGVILIEAALHSGSLITAQCANDQNREVFVVPGSPLDPRYAGSNVLIRSGASLITNAQDVLEGLKISSARFLWKSPRDGSYHTETSAKAPEDNDLSDPPPSLAQEVLSHLSPTPITLDELLCACSYSSSAVLSVLLDLELAGRVIRHPGNKLST